jgi:hypothetical protein
VNAISTTRFGKQQAAAPCFDGAADLPTEREQKADEWRQLKLVVVWVNIILRFFVDLFKF